MKTLNLYAGIGGNRKLWTDCEVTAVELNPQIAAIYQEFFPDDTVIVGDEFDLKEFLDIQQKSKDALSTTIKIDYSQVLDIVVGDLIEKYKYNAEHNNLKWATAFESVLRYYLDEDEMEKILFPFR